MVYFPIYIKVTVAGIMCVVISIMAWLKGIKWNHVIVTDVSAVRVETHLAISMSGLREILLS